MMMMMLLRVEIRAKAWGKKLKSNFRNGAKCKTEKLLKMWLKS